MIVPEITGRENLLHRTHEVWKPPVFSESVSGFGKIVGWTRRLLDLQAASLWLDLSRVLCQFEGTVVDVGCGVQPYRGLLNPGVKYIGIDTAAAEGQFGYLHSDTTYYDGRTFPLGDETADAVMATETLEHVAETEQFLAEMHRILKPGGTCVLTIPFAARWHYIPWDYYRFTPSGLNLILQRAGFESLAVYARGNSVTVAAYKVMAIFLALCLGKFRGPFCTVLARVAGACLLPLLALTAMVGQISLRLPSVCGAGDDCLGYTVFCRRGRDGLGRAPGESSEAG